MEGWTMGAEGQVGRRSMPSTPDTSGGLQCLAVHCVHIHVKGGHRGSNTQNQHMLEVEMVPA